MGAQLARFSRDVTRNGCYYACRTARIPSTCASASLICEGRSSASFNGNFNGTRRNHDTRLVQASQVSVNADVQGDERVLQTVSQHSLEKQTGYVGLGIFAFLLQV
jgi:hypothetical protein